VALTIKTLLRYGEVAPVAERMALPPPPAKRFALEARGSVLARPDPAARFEPRVAVTALYRLLPGGRLLLGLGVGAGPGLEVAEDDFDGRYQDTQISLSARYEVDLGRRISLAPTAGVTLHVASLGGTSASRGRSAELGFADPGLDVGLRLGAQLLPRLQIALVAEGSTLLRRQRYLDGNRELFDMPLVAGEVGLAIVVPLF
jgi:hypothetical protein